MCASLPIIEILVRADRRLSVFLGTLRVRSCMYSLLNTRQCRRVAAIYIFLDDGPTRARVFWVSSSCEVRLVVSFRAGFRRNARMLIRFRHSPVTSTSTNEATMLATPIPHHDPSSQERYSFLQPPMFSSSAEKGLSNSFESTSIRSNCTSLSSTLKSMILTRPTI